MKQSGGSIGRAGLMGVIIALVVTGSVRAQVYEDLNGFSGYLHSNGMPYRLFVPQNLDNTRSYPLVMFFHGAGGRGTDNTQVDGIYVSLSGCWKYPDQQTIEPVFILAPQCPTKKIWAGSKWNVNSGYYSIDNTIESPQMTKALEILDDVLTSYPIDRNRLYVTGQSMGGAGTWDVIMRHKNLWAAAIPVAGHNDTTKAGYLSDLPIWVHHCLDDEIVVPLTDTAMVTALEWMGSDVRSSWYAQCGHAGWVEASDNTETVSWMLSHTREHTSNLRDLSYREMSLRPTQDQSPHAALFDFRGRMVGTQAVRTYFKLPKGIFVRNGESEPITLLK